MGDPRKQRRTYSRPNHPWRGERIEEENRLSKQYGLKNKKELWRAKTAVGNFRKQARMLLGSAGVESDKEAKELLSKLNVFGIMESESLDDVLAITVENLLDRRLQTVVFKKGLCNTLKQARQLIVHKHVLVGKNIIDVPRYLVSTKEEDKIRLNIELEKPEPPKPKKKAAEEKPAEEKPAEEKPEETGEAEKQGKPAEKPAEEKTPEEKPEPEKPEEKKQEEKNPEKTPVEEPKKEGKEASDD